MDSYIIKYQFTTHRRWGMCIAYGSKTMERKMDMKEFDPAVAARVWQRVQASAGKAAERPACPIEGIRTVPAEPEKKHDRQVCRKAQGRPRQGCVPAWQLLVLVYVLLQISACR